MIGEKIVYAILFLAEAVTAWLYASYIYTAKRSPIYTFISFTLGYLLLFCRRSIWRCDDKYRDVFCRQYYYTWP